MKIKKENMEYIPKVWGYELIITNNDEYCGKIMGFNKGHSSSVHYHKLKKETFLLKNGKVQLEWLDKEEKTEDDLKALFENGKANLVILENGDAFELPRQRVHRVTALEDSEVIEFSTPSQDSDSYRITPSK
jgi:quercetin dioxygenase-like cupin family protein